MINDIAQAIRDARTARRRSGCIFKRNHLGCEVIDGTINVHLYQTTIATIRDDFLYLYIRRHNTPTTRKWINKLLELSPVPVRVRSAKGTPFLEYPDTGTKRQWYDGICVCLV